MTLYEHGGTPRGRTETFTKTHNLGDIGFANVASFWKCGCHAALEIEATCPESIDKTNIEGDYVVAGTFDGRPIYEKSTDSNGSWWYMRFDTPTDRWKFDFSNSRVTEGTSIGDSTVGAFDLNVEGEFFKQLTSSSAKTFIFLIQLTN